MRENEGEREKREGDARGEKTGEAGSNGCGDL